MTEQVELDRMADDGCPNVDDRPRSVVLRYGAEAKENFAKADAFLRTDAGKRAVEAATSGFLCCWCSMPLYDPMALCDRCKAATN